MTGIINYASNAFALIQNATNSNSIRVGHHHAVLCTIRVPTHFHGGWPMNMNSVK